MTGMNLHNFSGGKISVDIRSTIHLLPGFSFMPWKIWCDSSSGKFP